MVLLLEWMCDMKWEKYSAYLGRVFSFLLGTGIACGWDLLLYGWYGLVWYGTDRFGFGFV